MKESFNVNNKYNNVNYFFTKNAAFMKQHFKQTGNINKKRHLNILNNINTGVNNNTHKKQYNNSELFQLAQRMKLLRSKSSEDVMTSCSSWSNNANDKTRMKEFPIGKRIGMLKEMKDNINDVLVSEHGLKRNCLLKRSASTSSWIQPNEKGFDKEMNKMIKTIFYPHKQNERMFYSTNSNRSTNYSNYYSWSNSNNNNCWFRNGNCCIESPKLIKHTPRYKLKVPVYKDI
jgi:hypothetical protein